MGWVAANGLAPAAVGADGIVAFSTGDVPDAADFDANFTAPLDVAGYGLAAGVLAGGVCTAAALVVTIPDGTTYYARQVWAADGDATVNVTDEATTYVWGCSDGVVRITATSTPPSSFDARTACLLTVATATGGTASVDNTLQWAARQTDAASGVVVEGTMLDLSKGLIVPVVASDPSTLVNGMVWFRSDTLQLSIRVAGATKRSAAFS